MDDLSLEFKTLQAAYEEGRATPSAVVAEVLSRIAARGEDGVWIHRVPEAEVSARARQLETLPEERRAALPLYGIPFSVKDCIDVAGLPTTAACPAYEYIAGHTHLAVQKALDAGAILLGKTNMDQFATGVVGVRTPYGTARNTFNADYIPGGSSSGAGVSVSAGLCGFAFGTDTGGSGRVPASYNDIAGLKPTLGLFSRADMVNASRSFDTVSVFANDARDAARVLRVCQGVDPRDPLGRAAPAPETLPTLPERATIAVPRGADLEFFGNGEAAALFDDALQALSDAGHTLIEIDFRVFVETSAMMFEGPYIAERYASVGAFIEAQPEAVDPVVRDVILSARKYSAADAFNAVYRLRENAATICATFDRADLIVVPTVGTAYTRDDLAAEPVVANANNGRYLNFVSMSDLAAVAVPNGGLASGVPMGVTFVGPAFSDFALADFGARFADGRIAARKLMADKARAEARA